MGKRIQEKQSRVSSGSSGHQDRVWGILHIIKYHHWSHLKKRLTHGRHGGGRNVARGGIPGNVDASEIDNEQENDDPSTKFVKEKLEQSTPPGMHSAKARLRTPITDEISRKKGNHKRSSTCPVKSQLTRLDPIRHLESSDLGPLAGLLLNVESSELFSESRGNQHTADTMGVLPPVFSEESATDNEMCVERGTMLSSDFLEHNQIHEHQKRLRGNHTPLQEKLSLSNSSVPEERLIHAKILAADASPDLFKDFLDALDIINTNKDLLLKYLQDQSFPLAHHSNNQQAFNGKMRVAKSTSFPVPGSSSGSKDSEPAQLINKAVDYRFNTKGDTQLQNEIQTQNQALAEEGYNSSPISSQVHNQMAMKRFKDLKQKIKHVIEESKNEKHRTTMDGILHKIPYGKKLSQELKKILAQSKDPAIPGDGKDNATSSYDNRLSTYSFSKRQPFPMRTSSINQSAGRYSQLYETCFNKEVNYPRSERLRLRIDETGSTFRAPKSLHRFLSLPNLMSFSQSEEAFASQTSKERFSGKPTSISSSDEWESFELDDSYNQVLPITHVDNKNQENIAKVDHKEYVIRSDTGSGGNDDENAKEGIRIDDFRNLKGSCTAACVEKVAQSTRESITKVVETKSASSSDSISLDNTFDFEQLSVTSDPELKSGQADGFDNNSDQQDPKADYTTVEKSENFAVPRKHLNYDIPRLEVSAKNKGDFDYVRDVLKLSGFSGHQSLGIWYSDDQPVDPLVYEELEGCLLADPDCSGNFNEYDLRNHLLLFDLVNEVLLEIFRRSYSYYPKPLSSLSHIHPMPTGDYVLHEVWTLISWYLSSRSEDDLSLDYYVCKDLAKDDGWMNLQFDSECVGLELYDLIFDDLLEEIVCT